MHTQSIPVQTFQGAVDTTVERLKNLLSKQYSQLLEVDTINPDVPLLDDGLGLDSIMLVEFITRVENEFAINFSETDLNMEVFGSLHNLAEFISRKQVV